MIASPQRSGQRQVATSPPLAAADRHHPAPPVDVVEGQGDDLADAEPQVAHAPHHRQVAAAGRGAGIEVGEDGPKILIRERLGQAIHGPLRGRRYDSREGRVEAVRQSQEAEEAAQRGRQDGDRSGLQMTGVASEVVLEVGRPQALGVRCGRRRSVAPETGGRTAGGRGACARTSPQVCRRNRSYSARSGPCGVGGGWQASRVLLVEHPQQVVDRRPARDEVAGEAEAGTSRPAGARAGTAGPKPLVTWSAVTMAWRVPSQ